MFRCTLFACCHCHRRLSVRFLLFVGTFDDDDDDDDDYDVNNHTRSRPRSF